MNFKKALFSGRFVITAEIAPPRGTDISAALEEARLIKDLVDGINVTDNQRAIMHLSPISLCHKFVVEGISPIFQVTCRDRNRIALQSDLLSAWVLGIENILVLTGDSITAGDHPDAKEVFDLDSISLLDTARKLSSGKDIHDKPLDGSPRFLLGAAVNPGAEPREMQIIQLGKKISTGAEFFQTQLIFDIDDFKAFLKASSHLSPDRIKILAGIFPLKSAKQGRFLREKVPGIKIPDEILERLEHARDQQEEGVVIAWELIRALKDLCTGVHIMSMGNKETLLKLLKQAQGLR